MHHSNIEVLSFFFTRLHLVLFVPILILFFFFVADISFVPLSIPFLFSPFQTQILTLNNGCGFHPRQHKMFNVFCFCINTNVSERRRARVYLYAQTLYENAGCACVWKWVCVWLLILKWAHWMRNFSEKWALQTVATRMNCMVKRIFEAEKLLISRKLS